MDQNKPPEDAAADRQLGQTTRLDISSIVETVDSTRQRVPVLTILGGNGMGRSVVCDKPSLTLGRARGCELHFSDSGVSREHARVEPGDGCSVRVEDLGSTNGTFVNGRRIDEPVILEDGDCVHLGPIAVLAFSCETVAEYELRVRQYEHSTRDELTGIFNRRHLQLALAGEVAFARRYKDDLGVVMFDIDRFKVINDTYGHGAGDEVIRRLTDAVSMHLRKEDLLARYGGEEFTVVLRGLDAGQVCAFCERLRRLVEGLCFRHKDVELSVTISLGCASLAAGDSKRPEALIAEADACLYKAKAAGRNTIVGPDGCGGAEQ